MKKLLAFLIAFLLWGGAYADLVVSAGNGNELRLLSGPCRHGGILGMLNEEYRPQFKKAQASVEGKTIYACWIDTREGYYYVFFETGYGAAYPVSAFTDQPGV